MHCQKIKIIPKNVHTVCMLSNYLGQHLQRLGIAINERGFIEFDHPYFMSRTNDISRLLSLQTIGQNSIQIPIKCDGIHSNWATLRKSAILYKDCIRSVAPASRAADMASQSISICAISQWIIAHFTTAMVIFWSVRCFLRFKNESKYLNDRKVIKNWIILWRYSASTGNTWH